MGLEAAKADKSGKRWIQRSRQHPDPSLPSTAAPEQRGFVSCGTVTAGEVWPGALATSPSGPDSTPTSVPFTGAQSSFPVRELPMEQSWGWCSASLALCKALPPLSPWPHSPSPWCYSLVPPRLPNACPLNNLSAGKYFSDLHHTQIPNILKYNQQVAADAMTLDSYFSHLSAVYWTSKPVSYLYSN